MKTKFLLLILTLLGFSFMETKASVIYSAQNGDWNQGSTWSSGSAPGSFDSIVILHEVTLNVNFTTDKTIHIADNGYLQTTATNRTLTIGPYSELINHGEVAITKLTNQAGRIYNYSKMTISHDFINNSVQLAGSISDTAIIYNYDSIFVYFGNGNTGNFNNNAGYVYNYNYFLIDDFRNNEHALFWIGSDGWITTLSNVHNNGVMDNSGTFHSTANFLNNNATITGDGGNYIMDRNFNMGSNGVVTCYGSPIDICGDDGTPPGSSGLNNITDYNCVTICGDFIGSLPVELLFFDATFVNGLNIISWSTAVEINNDYFEILKSKDGKHWDVIERVYSKDPNSTVELNYMVRDQQIQSNRVYYYRLAQYDFDGSFELFEIKAVKTTATNSKNTLEAFPNPAVSTIQINTNQFSGGDAHLELINTMGQVVYARTIKLNEDLPQIQLSHVSAGMYQVRIIDQAGNTGLTTIIKK